jgi:hypothetical protein
MMTHYKKACAIYNLVDMKDDVSRMDAIISIKAAIKHAANDSDGTSCSITNSELEAVRNMYECNIHTKGIDSEVTINLGLTYAGVLQRVNRIEAERIMSSTISRRVH